MSFPKTLRFVSPLAAALAAACSDSTGPARANLDPVEAQADAQAMMAVFSAPALQQFQSASLYFDLGATATAAVNGSRELLASGGAVSSVQLRRLAAATGSARTMASRAVATLPSEALGTTFVFNEAESRYVPSDRSGAPANGVRFVLYAIDPITYEPVVTSEVGYVDLIDLAPSSQSSAGLRLVVVGGSTTYLDYSVLASGGVSSATVNVEGYLTDGVTRVNFDTDLTLTEAADGAATIDMDFVYDVPSREFSVRGAIDGLSSADVESGQMTLTVTSNRAEVRYVFQGDGTTLDVAVYVNGRIFATITGGEQGLTIRGAGGRRLTAQESAALRELLLVAEYSFLYFVQLMVPAGGLLGGMGG